MTTNVQDAHLRFLTILVQDPSRNHADAYMAVYPNVTARSAGVAAKRILKRPECAAKLHELERDIAERAMLNAADTAQMISNLATADARELIEYRIGCCRYCWGVGHEWQRTPREFREYADAYKAAHKADDPTGLRLDPQGGIGYNKTLAPHPACPECFGLGEGYEHVKDTRTLSAKSALLYAGVHRTRDGIKVLTRSQDKAVELLARHLGLMRPDPDADDENMMPPPSTISYNIVDAS